MSSSTLKTVAATAGVVVGAALVGYGYLKMHEVRREISKEMRAAAGSSADGATPSIGRDRLLVILAESANAAYQLIEQTRKMVHEKHKQTGCTLEQAVDELQTDFESALETVVSAIRAKHGVTEPAMTSSMGALQSDPAVAAAITALREAMGGKQPPNYNSNPVLGSATEEKPRRRGGKQTKRKG